MSLSVLRTTDFSTLAAIACAVAVYLCVGVMCWDRLTAHATTVEDAEMMVSSRLTVGGFIGKLSLIATWPLWTIVMGAVFWAIRTVRGKEGDAHERDLALLAE